MNSTEDKRIGFISFLEYNKKTKRICGGKITEYSKEWPKAQRKSYRFFERNLAVGMGKPYLYSFVQFDVIKDSVSSKPHATNIDSIITNRLGYIYNYEGNLEGNEFFGFLYDCTPPDEYSVLIDERMVTRAIKWDYDDGIYFNNYTFVQGHVPEKGAYVVFDIGYNPHTGRKVAMCKELIAISRIGYIDFHSANGGLVVDCETGEKYPYHAAPFFVQKKGIALPSNMSYVLFGIARNPINRPYAIIKTIDNPIDESGLKFKLSVAIEEKKKKIEGKRDDREVYLGKKELIGVVTSINKVNGVISSGKSSYRFVKEDNALFNSIKIDERYFFKLKRVFKGGKTYYNAIIKGKEAGTTVMGNITPPLSENATQREASLSLFKDKLLNKIRKTWCVEAKDERDDLFYVIDEYDEIANGDFPFVVGRKGTGKSAICNYLEKQIAKDSSRFNRHIKIEDVFFHAFYKEVLEARNDEMTDADYKLVWKYILYESVLQMMGEDESTDAQIRKTIKSLLPSNRLINKNPLSILRLGRCVLDEDVETEGEKDGETPVELSSIEKVTLLENCVKNLCSNTDNRYYILIDEIQKATNELNPEIGIRITKTLLMSIEHIHQVFSDYRGRLIPIAFVRDDTFRLVDYDDKEKWFDLTVKLTWNRAKIKKMLAYRISKTIDPQGPILSFDDAWRLLYPSMFTANGYKPLFENVYEYSYGRPRDFVYFLTQSCRKAKENDDLDLEKNWDSQIRDFAHYSSKSVEKEVQYLVPNLAKINDTIKKLGNNVFPFDSFVERYMQKPDSSSIEDLKKDFDTLYNFMLIGMIINSKRVFVDTDSEINLENPLIVHMSLAYRLGV